MGFRGSRVQIPPSRFELAHVASNNRAIFWEAPVGVGGCFVVLTRPDRRFGLAPRGEEAGARCVDDRPSAAMLQANQGAIVANLALLIPPSPTSSHGAMTAIATASTAARDSAAGKDLA